MAMRRRRGPGLLGVAARTAVVAGTATAVSGNVARRQHRRAVDQQERQAAQAQAAEQQAAPAPAPDPAPAAPVVDFEQLTKLGQMRDQGILTEDEFAATKARLLGI